ncbi:MULTISPECIES: hypothetical protein [Sorangium]|nr:MULTISPECIES: hypothetical protein [Sorangium]
MDPEPDDAQLAAIEEGLDRITKRARLLRIDAPAERTSPFQRDGPS